MKSQQNGKAPDILHHNSGIDVLALSFWRIESKSYIKSIREAAKRYDVVLIDCPPSLEDRTLAAIEAADTVLIPTEPEAHSLAGLTEIQQIVEAHNKQILGIVITRYNSKKAVHKFFVKEAYQFFPQFMLDTNVPDTTVFPSAAAAGQLGFEYWGNRKQKNVGLQAYTDIANVIVERLV